jgi:hypothetical protein
MDPRFFNDVSEEEESDMCLALEDPNIDRFLGLLEICGLGSFFISRTFTAGPFNRSGCLDSDDDVDVDAGEEEEEEEILLGCLLLRLPAGVVGEVGSTLSLLLLWDDFFEDGKEFF